MGFEFSMGTQSFLCPLRSRKSIQLIFLYMFVVYTLQLISDSALDIVFDEFRTRKMQRLEVEGSNFQFTRLYLPYFSSISDKHLFYTFMLQ